MALLRYRNLKDEPSYAYAIDGSRILFGGKETKDLPIVLIPNSDIVFDSVVETGAPLKVIVIDTGEGVQEIDFISEIEYPLRNVSVMISGDSADSYFNDDINSRFSLLPGMVYQFEAEDFVYFYKMTIEPGANPALVYIFLHYKNFNEK